MHVLNPVLKLINKQQMRKITSVIHWKILEYLANLKKQVDRWFGKTILVIWLAL